MEGHVLTALQSRLSAVERRLRLAVVGMFTLIVLVLSGVAVQHAASQATVIRAREIRLVDAMGQERIRLIAEDSTSGDSSILLRTGSGHGAHLELRLGGNGASVTLAGADPEGAVVLDHKAARSFIAVRGGGGKATAALTVESDDTNILMSNKDGHVVWVAP